MNKHDCLRIGVAAVLAAVGVVVVAAVGGEGRLKQSSDVSADVLQWGRLGVTAWSAGLST